MNFYHVDAYLSPEGIHWSVQEPETVEEYLDFVTVRYAKTTYRLPFRPMVKSSPWGIPIEMACRRTPEDLARCKLQIHEAFAKEIQERRLNVDVLEAVLHGAAEIRIPEVPGTIP